MVNELLLLIEKHTDTPFEQRKIRAQETLEFKLNKQAEIFFFSPSINLVEEGKELFAVTSFEVSNSVSETTDKNNIFSFGKPTY